MRYFLGFASSNVAKFKGESSPDCMSLMNSVDHNGNELKPISVSLKFTFIIRLSMLKVKGSPKRLVSFTSPHCSLTALTSFPLYCILQVFKSEIAACLSTILIRQGKLLTSTCRCCRRGNSVLWQCLVTPALEVSLIFMTISCFLAALFQHV